MRKLPKLSRGDKVAVLSPSFAGPGIFPHVYELGLKRLREIFELNPIEFPTTKKVGASMGERSKDLIDAFENPDIKAVIASLGGDDQVTYIKNLPTKPFTQNPKSFFGYSDNSHFCNFLFLNEIPSYYGSSLLTQFAMQSEMDSYTIKYIKHALFDSGEFELEPSKKYSDIELDWNDPDLLKTSRKYEPSIEWLWNGGKDTEGLLWGGCVESVDEMLRHGIAIPSLEQFKKIVLILETSEEIPSANYVRRVVRALGERGILKLVQGVCVGLAKAWEFDKPQTTEEKAQYRKEQRMAILDTVREYNEDIPVVQNMNFGHTDPQIPMPYGNTLRFDTKEKRIFATF